MTSNTFSTTCMHLYNQKVFALVLKIPERLKAPLPLLYYHLLTTPLNTRFYFWPHHTPIFHSLGLVFINDVNHFFCDFEAPFHGNFFPTICRQFWKKGLSIKVFDNEEGWYKGQKISKVNYLVLISSKKREKYLSNSALPITFLFLEEMR